MGIVDSLTHVIKWHEYTPFGIIHLVRTQNFHFLPPDTHVYVYVSGGKKCFFRKILRTYEMEDPFNITK